MNSGSDASDMFFVGERTFKVSLWQDLSTGVVVACLRRRLRQSARLSEPLECLGEPGRNQIRLMPQKRPCNVGAAEKCGARAAVATGESKQCGVVGSGVGMDVGVVERHTAVPSG